MSKRTTITDKIDLESLLGALVSKERITTSDAELLKLTQQDPTLTVIQSNEDFDWEKSTGSFYNIITERSFDKYEVSSLNEELDIDQVSVLKLAKQNKTYVIKGGLEYRDRETKQKLGSADLNLSHLNLVVTDNENNRFDLSSYALKRSGRSREFYGYTDQGVRDVGLGTGPIFNQTSVSAYFSDGKEHLSLVYRMSFEGKDMIGSKLYLDRNGNRMKLDNLDNQRIELFMRSLNEIHSGRFTETSCTTVNATEAVNTEPPKEEKTFVFLDGYG